MLGYFRDFIFFYISWFYYVFNSAKKWEIKSFKGLVYEQEIRNREQNQFNIALNFPNLKTQIDSSVIFPLG